MRCKVKRILCTGGVKLRKYCIEAKVERILFRGVVELSTSSLSVQFNVTCAKKQFTHVACLKGLRCYVRLLMLTVY